jgi:hypothetical protein
MEFVFPRWEPDNPGENIQSHTEAFRQLSMLELQERKK